LKKVLITGGAGFIGSNLVDSLLKENVSLIILDNYSTGRIQNLEHVKNDIEIIECDISIKSDWTQKFKDVDCVFHLAALADIVPSIENPTNYFNSNVTGTFNVLQACTENDVKRFIYSASSSCYGIPDKYPTPEISKIKPQYPYALTKYLGEELVLHWCKVYNLSSLSLRFFNVYGPRSRTSGTYGAVFGVFLAQKLANKPFTVVGDGKQTRDFTFVSDIVDALICAAKSNIKGEAINIGSGNTYSVNKLVELLKGEKIYIPKRPGEPDCTWADISKVKKLLKWEPQIKFEKGIKIILDNIEYWKEAPVWDEQSIAKATENWFKYLS
tara:strand:- start:1656 stop:2636 length:981 start_codon:yes stop_codon:yes gene_type:complete